MNRIPLGIPGLDEILGGGTLPGSVSLVEGLPGAGKTTLALQFIYEGIRSYDAPGIIVTFEESPEQLRRDAGQLGWDIQSLEARKKLKIMHISPGSLRQQLLDSGSDLERTAANIGARRLMVDSVNHFQRITLDPVELRQLFAEFVSELRRRSLTSFLIKEIEIGESPTYENYTADAVITLTNEAEGHRRARYLEVKKARGQGFLSGKHSVKIGPGGIAVFPSLAPEPTANDSEPLVKRVKTGVSRLDEMLDGGFLKGFANMIAGSSGTGKTAMGLHFLCAAGPEDGESSLVLGFEESGEEILAFADTIGLPLRRLRDEGRLEFLISSPADFCAGEWLQRVRETLERGRTTRVLIDSLTDLENAVGDDQRFYNTVYSLVRLLKKAGATSVMTSSVPEAFGEFKLSQADVSMLVDGIILLRMVEMESEIRKALSILKMRGSDFSKEIRAFEITDSGIELREKFAGREGVMRGNPYVVVPREGLSKLEKHLGIAEPAQRSPVEVKTSYNAALAVVHPSTRQIYADQIPNVLIQLLAPDTDRMMEALFIRLEEGATTGEQPFTHEGEEWGYCLSGSFELYVEGETRTLSPGDSFYFSSRRPHGWRNASSGSAEVIWVVTPPSF
ncbi:MAG: ATPase domain-containing protein [Armatimonadota bacterium]|nr:ATPase domain-containing protein [Armatimonadota bacterium]